MQQLVDQLEESANLVVLTGTNVRFILTIECHRVLRVGDLVGRTLPAHIASGGKAILAALPAAVVSQMYRSIEDVDLPKPHRELGAVR